MSEKKPVLEDRPNPLGAWFQFEQLRKVLEQTIKDIEFSNFNLSFGAKNELVFHQKLAEARTLIDKITELLNSGPPSLEARTHVS
jgi:exonuclease VII small subunit